MRTLKIIVTDEEGVILDAGEIYPMLDEAVVYVGLRDNRECSPVRSCLDLYVGKEGNYDGANS